MVEIKAVIKEIPKTGLLLKELPPEEMSEDVYRVQRIDLDEIAELTNTKLLTLLFSGCHRSRSTAIIDCGDQPGSGENVHNGYAFQWFAFATVLFIIYLLLNIKRRDESGKEHMSEEVENIKKSNRLTIILVVVMFISPLVLSWYVFNYTDYMEIRGMSNKGVIWLNRFNR